MSKRLEFCFDYGSPFSYLADTQLAGVASRTGAEIVYVPVILGAIFKATTNSSPISVPAKGRYMMIELERWARRFDVARPQNRHFPINTIPLMRGAVAAQRIGVFDRYHSATFQAFWRDGLNLGDRKVFAGMLREAGLPDLILTEIETRQVKDQARANTDNAVARGTFGAPTFFVGDQMFWGNDRLDWVEEALNRAR